MWGAVGSLVLLAVIVWTQVLHLGFVDWDDRENIFRNPMFLSGIDWHRIWTSFELESYYPLTLSFWALLVSAFGFDPFAFHLANFIVHGLNITLVWLFLTQLFGKDEKKQLIVLFLTGLFALHPLQVESVAWATEMKTLLCSFFILGSLNLYLLWRDSDKKLFFAFSLMCGVLAFLAKPLAITLPVWILAIEIWRPGKIRWKAWLPFAVLAIGATFIEMTAQNTNQALQSQGLSFYRPLSSLVFYTTHFFSPRGLAIFYDPQSMTLELRDYLIASGFWFLVIGAFFLADLQKKRNILASVLIFIGGLFPVLGFIPFGALSRFNDRYCYLPLIGLSLLTVLVAQEIFSRVFKSQAVSTLVAVISLILMSAITFQQIDVWQNSGTLWKNVLSFYPKTAKAHLNFGLYQAEQKNDQEAINEFQEALRLDSNCYRCRTNMAVVYADMGLSSEALRMNLLALQQFPNDIAVLSNVGNIYLQLGNVDEAKKFLERASKVDPNFPPLKTLQQSLERATSSSQNSH